METWRLLVSTGVLILVWATIVTLLGEPPGPASVALATLFGVVGIYLSDILVKRYVEPHADEE